MGEPSERAKVWAIELTAGLATGALLGAIGPFGSFFNDGLAVRTAYWTIVFLSSGVIMGVAIRTLGPRARTLGAPVWAWVPAMVLVIALPLVGLTRMIATVFWPAIRGRVGVVEWYGQTVLICLVYLALHAATVRWGGRPAPVVEKPEADAPRILRRLPTRLGGKLLCLSMEDHYVRLHTTKGSVLVLMSLGQALDELGGLEGLQVHRSWWVARQAVAGVIEDGRNLRLRLIDGTEAPVSRAKVASLRQAGWLGAE